MLLMLTRLSTLFSPPCAASPNHQFGDTAIDDARLESDVVVAYLESDDDDALRTVDDYMGLWIGSLSFPSVLQSCVQVSTRNMLD